MFFWRPLGWYNTLLLGELYHKLISFEACNLLVAVDQTVYEEGDGFPENLKTDDNLLRERVIVFILAWSASQTLICWRSRPMWTASMTFSPPRFLRAHHTIRFISGAYISRKQKKRISSKSWGGNDRANCNLTFWSYWGSQAGRGAEAWKFPWWLPQPGGLP